MAALSRRHFLGGAGAAGAGLVLTGCGSATRSDQSSAADAAGTVPFRGDHQPGIATPAQDRLAFAAFDVTSERRSDLRQMLERWTQAAERMTQARPVAHDRAHPQAPPEDTGEALGLPPSQLTITVGFGRSLFDRRFGLASKRPEALIELPHFPGEDLDREKSGGDLCIQACANDPQVAFHAVRNLARLGKGTVVTRWFQLGFGRTSSTSTAQATPRNLLGFKDGTNNIKAEHQGDMDRFVWDDGRDQSWMAGGSYVAVRRIRMRIEAWDRDFLRDQEEVFGREKISGAPLGRSHEFDAVDLAARGPDGELRVPADAHIRLASPHRHRGVKLLRRGYSFTDGMDPVTGELDAGLFFIAYGNDPRKGFVPIQMALARSDRLNEYIVHTGSGLFACPGGVRPGDSWGEGLWV